MIPNTRVQIRVNSHAHDWGRVAVLLKVVCAQYAGNKKVNALSQRGHSERKSGRKSLTSAGRSWPDW